MSLKGHLMQAKEKLRPRASLANLLTPRNCCALSSEMLWRIMAKKYILQAEMMLSHRRVSDAKKKAL